MANRNGEKYGFTGLFPITREQSPTLRVFLHSLNDTATYPGGSPFSHVPIIHMARLFVVDRLTYQGTPAKADTLKSDYLVFVCDFDGDSIDTLIQAMVGNIPTEVAGIWGRCVRFPGVQQRDLLSDYFTRCQVTTTLFMADQPAATVGNILTGLMCRRRLVDLIRKDQSAPRNAVALKQDFEDMWRQLQNDSPLPGTL